MPVSRHSIEVGGYYVHRSHRTRTMVREVLSMTPVPDSYVTIVEWKQVDPISGKPTGETGSVQLASFSAWVDDTHQFPASKT